MPLKPKTVKASTATFIALFTVSPPSFFVRTQQLDAASVDCFNGESKKELNLGRRMLLIYR